MAKGRELKGRIRSVENTRKITRTMEMVATSKMKRAQDRVQAARPYANSLAEVIASHRRQRVVSVWRQCQHQAGPAAPVLGRVHDPTMAGGWRVG